MPTWKDLLRAQGFDTNRDKPPIENYVPLDDIPALDWMTDEQKFIYAFSRTDVGQSIITRKEAAAEERAKAAPVRARFNRQVIRRLKNEGKK
jgi:hypothetical protein